VHPLAHRRLPPAFHRISFGLRLRFPTGSRSPLRMSIIRTQKGEPRGRFRQMDASGNSCGPTCQPVIPFSAGDSSGGMDGVASARSRAASPCEAPGASQREEFDPTSPCGALLRPPEQRDEPRSARHRPNPCRGRHHPHQHGL